MKSAEFSPLKAAVLALWLGASATTLSAQSTLNDGIPDAWRVQYFGAGFATNALALAAADADADGASNIQEYQSGTDPTNASSKPTVPVSVSTYAGTGVAGGQDGYRTNAMFVSPNALTLGPDGVLYVPEGGTVGGATAHRIRRVDTNGIVSTIAGTNFAGSSDGQGAVANFNSPSAIVFDSSGNAFVAESGGHRIRRVDANGMVATFAGSGVAGFRDDIGTNAQFNNLIGMTIDKSDNLYVADFNNRRIRRINPQGQVTTYAGTGASGSVNGSRTNATFNGVSDVAIGPDGSMFVADWGNGSVRKIDTNDIVVTLKSGMTYMERLGVDSAGCVYASMRVNATTPRFHKLSPSGATLWSFTNPQGFQDGVAANARFSHFTTPVVYPNGNLVIPDVENNRLRLVTVGVPAAVAVSPNGGAFTNAVSVTLATGLTNVTVRYTVDGTVPTAGSAVYAGALTLTNTATVQARAFVNTNPVSDAVSASFTNANSYAFNDGIPDNWRLQYFGTNYMGSLQAVATADPDGDGMNNFQEYQAGTSPTDAGSKLSVPLSVSTYAGTGAAGGQDGYRTNATFNNPSIVVLGPDGAIYVSEETEDISGNDIVGAQRIRRIDPNGTVATFVGNDTPGSQDGPIATATLRNPTDFNFDGLGNMFITEEHMHRIRKVSFGGMVSVFAGSPAGVSGYVNGTGTNALFSTPVSVVAGSDNSLYVADFNNNVIRKVTSGGMVTTYAGGFSHPSDVVRGPDGTLWVSDWGNAAIKKMDTNGVVSTFKTGLSYIERLGVDGEGNVYAALGNVGTSPRSLYKFSPSGAQQWVISTAMGYEDGPVGSARFNHFCKPLVLAGGNILHCDNMANRIRLIQVGAPPTLSISPNGGTFTNAVSVTLATGLTNVTVRYTVDGTVPTVGSAVYLGALTLTNTATVQVRAFVNTNPVSDVVSASFSRTAGQSPFITSQPQSQTVTVGGSAIFAVEVAGTLPVAYQWKLNGTNMGGATNATLSLTNVQLADAGVYGVMVSNVAGTVTSSNVTLTITTLSQNLFDDFDPGIDTPQWSAFGGMVLATNYGGVVSGNNSLWFGGVGSRFAATRTLNVAGGGVISYHLRLAAGTNSATWERADLPGDGVVLEYSTDGGGLWTVIATNNTSAFTNWTQQQFHIPVGAQSASTLFRWRQLANSGASFDHWALDDVGIQTFTNPVAPAVLSGPSSRMVVAGDGTTFSVVVSGTAPFTYQWQFNGTNIAGATSSTLALANVQPAQAGSYSVIVGNTAGTAASSNAVLMVSVPACVPAPSGLVAWWPGDGGTDDVVAGNSAAFQNGLYYGAGKIGQSFSCNGTNYVQLNSTSALNFSGTNAMSVEFWAYRTGSNTIMSLLGKRMADQIQYQIGFDPVDGLQFVAGYGGQSLRLLLRAQMPINSWTHMAVTYDGVTARFYTNGIVGVSAIGSLGVVLNTPLQIGAADGISYPYANFIGLMDEVTFYNRALSSNEVAAIYGARGAGKCAAAPTLAITSQPQGQTVTVGGSASFGVGVSGTLPISYQWRFNGTNVAGATNGTLTLANVQFAQAGDYSVVVSNVAGVLASSNATLTVSAATVRTGPVWLNNYDAGNYSGAPIYLFSTSTLAPADTFVQVLGGPLNGPLLPIVSETTHSSVNRFNEPGFFDAQIGLVGVPDDSFALIQVLVWRDATSFDTATIRGSAIFTNITGRSGTSVPPAPPMPATLEMPSIVMQSTTTAAPVITLQPQGRTVIGGSSATFGVVAGGSPAVSYQWRFNGADIPGATNANFTIANAQAAHAGSYSVFVSNSAGNAVSDAATLTVRYLLAVTAGAGGTVSKNPSSADYALNTVVELTAVPNAGFAFAGWSGDVSGTVNPVSVTVSTNKSVVAGFVENVPPVVTITSPASGNSSNKLATLAGTVSDNVGVVSIRWERNGQPVGALALDGNAFLVDPLVLARGTNVFRVIAADAAGNEGSAQVTVVYAPPRVLAVVNPAAQQEGREVTVPLELTSSGDVAGMSFVLRYDANYLKEPELKWSSATASALELVNTSVAGEVRATFALPAITVRAGTEQICEVIFRARSVPTNLDTALTLEVSDVADAIGNPITVDADAGSARILVRNITGDNNANNRLDTGDATIIQRMLAGLETPRVWDVTGNDLNASTTLDSGDVIKVMRAVVKLDPQPNPPGNFGSPGKSIKPKAVAAVVSPVEIAVVSPNGLRGGAGSQVTVQVQLSNIRTQLAGAEFTLDYPTNALRLVNSTSHQPGSLVSGDTFALWNVQPAQTDYAAQSGRVVAGFSSGTSWSPATNGVLAEFTFQVQPGAANQYRWPLVLSGVQLTTADGYATRPVADAQMYFIGRDALPASLGSGGVPPRLSGGQFSFGLGGELGVPYLIEVSTNLANWLPLQTVTNVTGTLQFNDPGATNSAQRYYRARQLE